MTQGVANLRTYWSHVYDICQTSFSSTYLLPWAQHYNNFVGEDLTQYMSYVDTRRAYALAQLGSAIPSVPFAITTPNGSAPVPTVTIAGNAWVDVAQMRLAGSSVPLAITWTATTTSWRTSIAIAPGQNVDHDQRLQLHRRPAQHRDRRVSRSTARALSCPRMRRIS